MRFIDDMEKAIDMVSEIGTVNNHWTKQQLKGWDELKSVEAGLDGSTTLNEKTAVQISTIKDIQREIRAWILKGEVVTASQYRMNERTVYAECTEPYILNYVKNMCEIYQPAEAFVMDVALTDKGMKIVEINCINCAGFYESNLQKLVLALDDAFTIQS